MIINKQLDELLLKDIREYSENDKEILRNEGIINGVGGSNIPHWMRKILTLLFFYLDFEIHDINYWKISYINNIILREEMRKKADFGLLKYSWIGPIRIIEKFSINGNIFKNIGNIEYTLIMFTLNLIPMLFSPLIYISVRIGGGKAINKDIYEKKILK